MKRKTTLLTIVTGAAMLSAALPIQAAVLFTVDPDGTGPTGGSIKGVGQGSRVIAVLPSVLDGSDVNGIDASTIYVHFSMEVSSVLHYSGFELWHGADLGDPTGHPNNVAMIGTLANNNWRFIGNRGAKNPQDMNISINSPGTTSHEYVIKIEWNDSGEEILSLFIDPTAGTEASNTADYSGTATLASIGRVGFGSFTANPLVTYSNVTFSTEFNDVVTIPEPSSAALLGLGSLALIRRRRR